MGIQASLRQGIPAADPNAEKSLNQLDEYALLLSYTFRSRLQLLVNQITQLENAFRRSDKDSVERQLKKLSRLSEQITLELRSQNIDEIIKRLKKSVGLTLSSEVPEQDL